MRLPVLLRTLRAAGVVRYRKTKDALEIEFAGAPELPEQRGASEADVDPEAQAAAAEQKRAGVKKDPLRAALEEFDPIDMEN